MQYLKEEIKNRIMTAALKEFDKKGFEKASMVQISNDAKVAIGNIYRYFRNKDELFNAIMEPAYNQFSILVFDQYSGDNINGGMEFDVKEIVTAIIEVYTEYKIELLILMDKSEGSKYQNTKENLIHLVHERLQSEYVPLLKENGIQLQDTFLYVLAATLLEGIFIIFRKVEDKEEVKKQVNQLLIFYFHKLIERF